MPTSTPRSDLEVYRHVHVPANKDEAERWILHLGYATNPLPMNGSRGASHWGHTKKSREARDRAAMLARAAKIPLLGSCKVQLIWWVSINRIRDVDNLGSFEKPLYDGLVDARVVPDDAPAFMDKLRPEIRNLTESGGHITEPGFTLTITRTDVDDEWGDD